MGSAEVELDLERAVNTQLPQSTFLGKNDLFRETKRKSGGDLCY